MNQVIYCEIMIKQYFFLGDNFNITFTVKAKLNSSLKVKEDSFSYYFNTTFISMLLVGNQIIAEKGKDFSLLIYIVGGIFLFEFTIYSIIAISLVKIKLSRN